MEIIQLNSVTPLDRYACRGISVNPNPPRVGEATTLGLAFKNTGPETITLNRIQFMVAAFGMGLGWEQLPVIEDIRLPADAKHVEEIAVQWTPTVGGHRCVRVTVESDVLPLPLRIGRNLEIIQATADRNTWHVPFHLGNPENERAPVMLELGGENTDGVDVIVLVNGRQVQRGQPVWLNAHEAVEARMLLRARTPEAIAAVKTVEASIHGRFIDGIQIEVYRPAYVGKYPMRRPERGMRSEPERVDETVSVLVH